MKKKIPQPSILTYLSALQKVVAGRLGLNEVFLDCFQKYGDVFCIKHLATRFYFFNHPDHVKYIYHDHSENFFRRIDPFVPFHTKCLIHYLGGGLITSEGKAWAEPRKVLSKFMFGSKLDSLFPLMTQVTAELSEHLETQAQGHEKIDLLIIMRKVTLLIIGHFLFSISLLPEEDKMRHALDVTMLDFIKRMVYPLPPLWFPSRANLKLKKAQTYLDKFIGKFYQERLNKKDSYPDILSILMKAEDSETRAPYSFTNIRDHIITLLFAGHETTASALTWILLLIATHPEVDEKIDHELTETLHGRLPCLEDLKSLPYTKRVIQEAMRLYPPVNNLGRTNLESDEIGGYEIKERSEVITHLYALHRHPDFWDHPNEFDPERFHPDKAASIHSHAYLPFGAGIHLCAGRDLAMMEMLIIVAILLQRFKINISPHTKIAIEAGISTRPKYPIWATLEPRTH